MSKRPRKQSLGDFADSIAQAGERGMTEEADLIRLSSEDQICFLELLLDTLPLVPAMEGPRKSTLACSA